MEQHGPESVAFLPAKLFPKKWRSSADRPSSAWGLVHGDGNTRQCMATAVTAYKKESFGFDVIRHTY